MKTMNTKEMMEVNGGKKSHLHCTVCCTAGAPRSTTTYDNNLVGQIKFALHCSSSRHDLNVRRYGYGHNCCWYAKN